MHSGVYQASVLGSILFSIYIKPLPAIIYSNYCSHCYSDDFQLLMPAPTDKISKLLLSMQPCIGDVNGWEIVNMLKLNDNRTKLMLVTSKELSISITFLLQSLSAMLNFTSNSLL